MGKKKALEEGYFTLSDDGELTLIGSYSKAANEYFFPCRKLCPITGQPVEDVALPREGILYSWTWVSAFTQGSLQMGTFANEHGVGQIDLPNGVRVQAVLEGKMGDWAIGMPMAVKPLTIVQKDDLELCSFQFAVVESGGR